MTIAIAKKRIIAETAIIAGPMVILVSVKLSDYESRTGSI